MFRCSVFVLCVHEGCELSSEVPFYTFQADEEEDLEHFLELRTVRSRAHYITF